MGHWGNCGAPPRVGERCIPVSLVRFMRNDCWDSIPFYVGQTCNLVAFRILLYSHDNLFVEFPIFLYSNDNILWHFLYFNIQMTIFLWNFLYFYIQTITFYGISYIFLYSNDNFFFSFLIPICNRRMFKRVLFCRKFQYSVLWKLTKFTLFQV
jgi:hypothetical protein